jgi:hypothetical protein
LDAPAKQFVFDDFFGYFLDLCLVDDAHLQFSHFHLEFHQPMFYLCKLLCDASLARELATIKEAVKSASPSKKEAREIRLSSPWKAWAIRGAILLMGIVLVLLGIFNGGAEDVLGKAIRICTECIGLG